MDVIDAIYGVMANAKTNFNSYFALPTEKDFSVVFECGYRKKNFEQLQTSLEFLWVTLYIFFFLI
jgi:hypothetical protein